MLFPIIMDVFLYFFCSQVIETKNIPAQSPSGRRCRTPMFYAAHTYDGCKVGSLFNDDEKENKAPEGSQCLTRRSSIRSSNKAETLQEKQGRERLFIQFRNSELFVWAAHVLYRVASIKLVDIFNVIQKKLKFIP